MPQWKTLVASAMVVSALWGCGGDGDNHSTSPVSDAPVTPPTGDTPPAEPPPPMKMPYAGTLSFGDSVVITLDAPSAGHAQVRFADSAFGLGGTIFGTYTLADGVYHIGDFAADSDDLPPSALIAGLSDIALTLRVKSDVLSGEITGVPNLLATGAGKLAGSVSASLAGTVQPTLESLAGTYNFVAPQAAFDKRTGKQLAPLDFSWGIAHVDASGNVKLCFSGDAVDCATPTPATLVPSGDRTKFPNAFDLTSASVYFGGRVFVNRDGGLRFDLKSSDAATLVTGTWILTPVKALASGDLDGSWSCSHATTVSDGASVVMDGTLTRDVLTIAGGKLTAASSGTPFPITLNSLFGLFAFEGLATAGDPSAVPDTELSVLLPSGSDALSWAHLTASAATVNTCQRNP